MQRRNFLKGAITPLLLLGITNISCGAPQIMSNPTDTASRKLPLYPPLKTNEVWLKNTTAPFLAMSDEELIKLVPPQAGFLFSGCPNPDCQGGRGFDGLTWNLALGDKVQCKNCKETYPNAQYPDNGELQVKTPTGGTQIFRYYQDAKGEKYWFDARRWFVQRELMEDTAYNLAQLYRIDPVKYADAGRKSLAIIQRFAEVYPDYIVTYDYPGLDKVFFTNGNGVDGYRKHKDGAYRAAKWSAWAYMDISNDLLLAYDQLAGIKILTPEVQKKIETDLFGGMIDFVAQYKDMPFSNMHPTLWRSQAIAANVLRRPELASTLLSDIRLPLQTLFTSDGFWKEGTVSYHLQTVKGFQNVLEALHPGSTPEELEKIAQKSLPDLYRTIKVTETFRLPNGHYAAINDTWAKAKDKYSAPLMEKSVSILMPGMGYGILGLGQREQQLQAHLKFSGRFGHTHLDSLNLLLFGEGKELISDLGYTHTKARPWATSTASHSTVLVDGKNQSAGVAPNNARGNLLLFNAQDAALQAVEASAPEAYPGLVSTYKRALITVQTDDAAPYVVDIFQVAGGARHDWILHGSADEDQQLELDTADGARLPLSPLPSLLPADFKFEQPVIESRFDLMEKDSWALGNFRNIEQGKSDAAVKATFRFVGEPKKGLQSWILGAPGSALFTARSWNVRGAVEDQSKLDEHLRASLIVRRQGTSNRFVAVHIPFEGDALVQQVTQLDWPTTGVALKIERGNAVDYVLYQPEAKAQTGNIAGQQVQFDGRIALIRVRGDQVTLKMIGGNQLRFGAHKLTGTPHSARLLNAKDNTFTVEGRFDVVPGQVIIMRHADERTSAFRVAKIQNQGANTIIETQEPASLAGDGKGTLKMLFFPHAELPGPHQVTADVLFE